MKYFDYGHTEIDFLKNSDEVLGDYIDKTGILHREMYDSLFDCLVSSIVGQQISNKALSTVLARLDKVAEEDISPQKLIDVGVQKIQSCGMSLRKANNLINLSKKIVEGEICFETMQNQPDEQIVENLISLDGVGVWTAEMALIFALGRKNVMSYGDFGIKKGLCLLYGIEKPDKKTFEFYRRKFSPYGTIASFYLWDIANKN